MKTKAASLSHPTQLPTIRRQRQDIMPEMTGEKLKQDRQGSDILRTTPGQKDRGFGKKPTHGLQSPSDGPGNEK